ncbi:hypothetical protein PG988_013968 [Apiospora saccharicola]
MKWNLSLPLVALAAGVVKAADQAEATAAAQAADAAQVTDAAQATDAAWRGCNNDRCLRRIRGNYGGWPPPNVCQTDCSSYVVTTVTPTPPVTTTVTITITPGPYRRDDAAVQTAAAGDAADARRKKVPSYFTTSTYYLPTPTVTVTATVTARSCPGGKTWCRGQCKDCNTDHDNCGKCGNSVSTSPFSSFPSPPTPFLSHTSRSNKQTETDWPPPSANGAKSATTAAATTTAPAQAPKSARPGANRCLPAAGGGATRGPAARGRVPDVRRRRGPLRAQERHAALLAAAAIGSALRPELGLPGRLLCAELLRQVLLLSRQGGYL